MKKNKEQKYLHVFEVHDTGEFRFDFGTRLSWRVCVEDYLGRIKLEEYEDEEGIGGLPSTKEVATQITSKKVQ
jgi:hypothetical protein